MGISEGGKREGKDEGQKLYDAEKKSIVERYNKREGRTFGVVMSSAIAGLTAIIISAVNFNYSAPDRPETYADSVRAEYFETRNNLTNLIKDRLKIPNVGTGRPRDLLYATSEIEHFLDSARINYQNRELQQQRRLDSLEKIPEVSEYKDKKSLWAKILVGGFAWIVISGMGGRLLQGRDKSMRTKELSDLQDRFPNAD